MTCDKLATRTPSVLCRSKIRSVNRNIQAGVLARAAEPAPAPSGSRIPDCHTGAGKPRLALGARKARGECNSFAFAARRRSSRDCKLHQQPCAELTAHTVGSSFPLGLAPPVCSRDRLHTPANRFQRLQGAPCRAGLLDPHAAGSGLLCGFSPNFAMGRQLPGSVAGPRPGRHAAARADKLHLAVIDRRARLEHWARFLRRVRTRSSQN